MKIVPQKYRCWKFLSEVTSSNSGNWTLAFPVYREMSKTYVNIFFKLIFIQFFFANEFDFFQRTLSKYSNQVSPIYHHLSRSYQFISRQKTRKKHQENADKRNDVIRVRTGLNYQDDRLWKKCMWDFETPQQKLQLYEEFFGKRRQL